MRAPLFGLLIVTASCGEPWRLDIDRASLVSDGRDKATIRIERRHGFVPRWWHETPRVRIQDGPADVRLAPVGKDRWLLTVGRTPGRVRLVAAGAQTAVQIQPAHRDEDRDGLPDAIELRSEDDRAAFTAWFTAIAEAQFHHLDDAWAPIHRDCAGLVRFAFREALKPHGPQWWSQRRWQPGGTHADVGLSYPDLPIVGDRPFRRRGGAFDPQADLETQFTAAPNARTLWQHNADLISRDITTARAGDLLFFRHPRASQSDMHTMIALGARPGSSHRAQARRLVYHTGSTAQGPGEVRLVTVDALLQHPEPGWRPVPHNPQFLGVHRLRHLTAPIERAWAGFTRSVP